jgi:hypothetical protein
LNWIFNLVGGFKHGFYFPFHIWDNGIILSIGELIFFKMVETIDVLFPLVG